MEMSGLFERRYGYPYDGADPRNASIGEDAKIGNLGIKYHWIAYLLYFSGEWFRNKGGIRARETLDELGDNHCNGCPPIVHTIFLSQKYTGYRFLR